MEIKYFKDEPFSENELDLRHNRIAELENFISPSTAIDLLNYIESRSDAWNDIYFYGSSGMNVLEDDPSALMFNLKSDFLKDLLKNSKDFVSEVFSRDLVPVSFNVQKMETGGYAIVHSDHTDFDGVPNAYERSKYATIIYLNDDYEGGELYFPEHGIDIKPKAGAIYTFSGGIQNLHGVREVLSGTRYNLIAFWDHAEAEYSDEKKKKWQEEIDVWLEKAEKQKKRYIDDMIEETE